MYIFKYIFIYFFCQELCKWVGNPVVRTNIALGTLSVQPLGKGTHQNKSDPPRWVWLAGGGAVWMRCRFGWHKEADAAPTLRSLGWCAGRWMLETQASSYAAAVDRCLSASYRENLQNVLGCFRDGEVLSGIADTVALIWRRSDLAGGDGGRVLFFFVLSLLKGHISLGQTLTKRALHWKPLLSLMLLETYDFYSAAFIRKNTLYSAKLLLFCVIVFERALHI